MHTFRKLPTMQPSAKKHSDQKWNGTSSQLCASKMASMPINKMLAAGLNHMCSEIIGRRPPLTPALFPEKRENYAPLFRMLGAWNRKRVIRKTHHDQTLFPLPGGEGQGEG